MIARRPSRFRRPLGAALIAVAVVGCAAKRERTKLAPLTRPTTRIATQPFSRPASRPSYHVSDVYAQTLPAQTYFYRSVATTYPELEKTAQGLLAEVADAAAAHGVTLTGRPLLVYHNAAPSVTKPFVLDVGFPAAGGTEPFGPFLVRTLPALHCASVVHTGPGSTIDKGYDKLVPAVEAAKLRRTGETREVYLRWDGPDGPENQVMLAIGIE